MDEKELDEKELDINKLKERLRETEFLRRIAEYRTMMKQMNGVDEECQKQGKDVRDTFHVVGTRKEGDKTLLHIVTSGKEGEESARQTLMEIAEAKDADIENKSTKRYDEKEDRELLDEEIEEMFRRKLKEGD